MRNVVNSFRAVRAFGGLDAASSTTFIRVFVRWVGLSIHDISLIYSRPRRIKARREDNFIITMAVM